MPMDKSRYPRDWGAIAHFLKSLNNWECAQCGRPCRRPGESLGDLEDRSDWPDSHDHTVDDESGEWGYVFRAGRFTLTVAHLDHHPPNCHPENLLPLCAPCHCRMDIHPKALAVKRRLKREWQGQLRIPGIYLSGER